MVVMRMTTRTIPVAAAKNQGQGTLSVPDRPSIKLPEGYSRGYSGQVRWGVSTVTPVAKPTGGRQGKRVGKEVQVEKSGKARQKEEKEQRAKERRVMKYLLKLCNVRAGALACPGFKHRLRHLLAV